MQNFSPAQYPDKKNRIFSPLAYFWVVTASNAYRRMRQVLIIGNEGFVRDMIACAIDRTGVAAVCVEDPAEVEQECRSGRFERVVVLGCSRFADGRITVERLRPKGARRPEIYVLSWHHSEHAVLSLLECGVNQYITFPVNLRRLCRKIGEATRDAML